MCAIQPCGLGRTYEKLRSVCVFTSICHRQYTRSSVLQAEIFVCEFLSVYRLASSTVAVSDVTSLAHKVRNDTMENATFIAVTIFPCANLTMMMGAYGGEKDELLLHPDNPLKYWERRDVVALDEARLAAGLNEAISQRYDMPSWVAYGFDAEKAAAPVHGSAEAKAIVSKLNEKRPWVTKDPRMSLVASEWMQLLDAPACIIMHREPLSVANSMMIYSHNVSLAEWISVYENYYASTMRACKGVPTVVVQHEEFAKAPYAALQKLHAELEKLGVQGLQMPAESRVSALLKPSTAASPFYLASERGMVSTNAQKIATALTAGTTLETPASWLAAPRRNKEAIATLLTTTNADYLRGALALGAHRGGLARGRGCRAQRVLVRQVGGVQQVRRRPGGALGPQGHQAAPLADDAVRAHHVPRRRHGAHRPRRRHLQERHRLRCREGAAPHALQRGRHAALAERADLRRAPRARRRAAHEPLRQRHRLHGAGPAQHVLQRQRRPRGDQARHRPRRRHVGLGVDRRALRRAL